MGVWVEGEGKVSQGDGGRVGQVGPAAACTGLAHGEGEKRSSLGAVWMAHWPLSERPHQLLPNHSLSSVPEAPPEG